MGQEPEREDSERVITPRTLWTIVFGGTTIFLLVGFALLVGKCIDRLSR